MAVLYSQELSTLASAQFVKPNASSYAARLRRYRATITLATQTTSDTIVIGQIPAGETFAYGIITTSVSLGTSTLAIGIAGATSKYDPATTYTAVDTPTLFGTAAQASAVPLAAEERIFITIGVASLPASGTLVVDLYFSRP